MPASQALTFPTVELEMGTVVVDYAENLIKLKQYVRAIEEALLKREFKRASELSVLITVESRLLGQNTKLINDNDGIPYQVELQRSQDV